MADIDFKCPYCSTSLTVDESEAGHEAPCPKCSCEIRVPSSSRELLAKRNPPAVPRRIAQEPEVMSSSDVLRMRELELRERELALREREIQQRKFPQKVEVEGKKTARTLKAIGSLMMISSVVSCSIGAASKSAGAGGLGGLLFLGGFFIFVIGRFFD